MRKQFFILGFVLPRSSYFSFHPPPVAQQAPRPKKSGHSIRDILGDSVDDDVSSKKVEKNDSSPAPPPPEKMEAVSTADHSSAKDDQHPTRSRESEDEDVHVDVDDEEQLWD